MRFSLVSLLPVVISLSAFVAAHNDHSFEAREMDTLSARDIEKVYFDNLERRELLSEFTTRELLDELVERAPAGGSYTCPYCGTVFSTAAGASQCASTHNVNLRKASRKK
ncbi:hypothetical protein EST38_g5694 [Candolleomyces aberdarensis]|uniref:C2H2-type domain-containing protein n=1 Tax=Candolleomyces aberdarensis TaxID=2316362 RepID=A0A4V1Q3X9_9AGAR|nr:hypothetical protein EST38_g5694 [Candolleomyces aberdarensis]